MRCGVVSSLLPLLSSLAVCAHAFVTIPLVSKSRHLAKTPGPDRTSETWVRMSTSPELPTQAARQQALYDMVYVERLPEEQQMASGLFLPSKENPRMHVCKVISLGDGREGESGNLTPSDAVKPGDLVYVKDPYGIGPRDDEFAGKKFSFVRYTSICAIIPDSQEYEDAARQAGNVQADLEKATAAPGSLVF